MFWLSLFQFIECLIVEVGLEDWYVCLLVRLGGIL